MTKDEILDEIRRTAAENGGVPLGKGRFFELTGIKESDWSGRFWSKWGDALSEAGFQPNRFGEEEYSKEQMLDQLAAITRRIGHVPTHPEIGLLKRTDPLLANAKTFRKHFGNKAEVVSKLRAHCAARAELHDVLELLPAEREVSAEASRGSRVSEESTDGFVYLLKSGRFYKIGRTNSLGRREYEIALQLPEKAQTVHTIRTDDPVGIEAYWHQRFANRRKNGEWFELTAADVQAFRRRKFM